MNKLVLCLSLIALPALADPPPPKVAALTKLARARIDAAEKRSQRLKTSYQAGTVGLSDVLESRALVFVAMRDSPIRGPERVKAAEEYLASVTRLREIVAQRVNAGAASQDDMLAIEYRVAEAQYWLEEAR